MPTIRSVTEATSWRRPVPGPGGGLPSEDAEGRLLRLISTNHAMIAPSRTAGTADSIQERPSSEPTPEAPQQRPELGPFEDQGGGGDERESDVVRDHPEGDDLPTWPRSPPISDRSEPEHGSDQTACPVVLVMLYQAGR